MNKTSIFLFKTFVVLMTPCLLLSESKGYTSNSENEKTYYTNYMGSVYTDESNSAKISQIRICPNGTYVARCGSAVVGLNWLKNTVLPMDYGSSTYYSTDNYLIYEDKIKNFDQMRAFFAHENIKYQICSDTTPSEDNSLCDDKIVEQQPPAQDRDMILGYMCNPLNGVSFQCIACPNGAWVDESLVYRHKNRRLLIRDSWVFHTIADCYLTKFEDNTGTFIFTQEPTFETDETGEKCYFSSDEDGTYVYGTAISVE